MNEMNERKFHSQDKNQSNPSRGCRRLWRIRLGEEQSLQLGMKLIRRANSRSDVVPEERPAA